MKNHSCNLHVPICGIFCLHSVDVVRYAALIQAKSPINCNAHLTESIFQTHSRPSSKSIYCLHLIRPKSSQRQKEGKQRCHICGLGAKVGCEHISEHSTCSDESHKYGIVASLPSSVLPVFVCYPSNE